MITFAFSNQKIRYVCHINLDRMFKKDMTRT